MYIKARGVRYMYQHDRTSLGQRFEGSRRGRPADVFNILQKRPNTVVHLKVDEAMEGCRSHYFTVVVLHGAWFL